MIDSNARIVALVQARMTSQRLPGKVLTEVQGKPLLQYLWERLKRCRELQGIVVATSDAASDEPVNAFATALGITCHRGMLDNVASRMLMAARAEACTAFVRISGDSPLMDPALVDRAVALFRAQQPDLVSNVLVRSFPKGQSVEVISVAGMERAMAKMTTDDEREHVTPYFYAHPDDFRIVGFEAEEPLAEMRLCVDTGEDLSRFASIIQRLGEPHWNHDLSTVVTAAKLFDTRGAAGESTS